MSKPIRRAFAIRVAASLACMAVLLVAPGEAQRSGGPSTDVSGQLRWRHIGPEGNRVSAVAGVAGDPRVYYVGAASGGIFKSSDGGVVPTKNPVLVVSIEVATGRRYDRGRW